MSRAASCASAAGAHAIACGPAQNTCAGKPACTSSLTTSWPGPSPSAPSPATMKNPPLRPQLTPASRQKPRTSKRRRAMPISTKSIRAFVFSPPLKPTLSSLILVHRPRSSPCPPAPIPPPHSSFPMNLATTPHPGALKHGNASANANRAHPSAELKSSAAVRINDFSLRGPLCGSICSSLCWPLFRSSCKAKTSPSTRKHRQQSGLVEHGNLQLLGLGQLRPRFFAGYHVTGLLAHRA